MSHLMYPYFVNRARATPLAKLYTMEFGEILRDNLVCRLLQQKLSLITLSMKAHVCHR